MDNPETLATLGIQYTGRRQIKTENKARQKQNTRQKTEEMSNTDPTKNRG